MKKVFLLLAALAVTPGMALASGDAASGQSKAAACGACHGADGNSPSAMFPKLAGQGEKYLLKQMTEIKSGARSVPTMTGQLNRFNEQDMADIAAYFSSKAVSVGAAKADLIELGERLYRSGDSEKGVPACTACHSPTGSGNGPAGFPAVGGQHAGYLVSTLMAFRSEQRSNDGSTRVMRDIAYRLNDQEIEAVSSYISGLH